MKGTNTNGSAIMQKRCLRSALTVVLVLGLQGLDLGREALQGLHGLELLERQRNQGGADDDGQRDDREAPREAGRVVEEHEHVIEDVDQRLDGVGDREEVHRLGSRRRNRRWASTGSKPPWLNGLQRSTRHAASTSPRSMP